MKPTLAELSLVALVEPNDADAQTLTRMLAEQLPAAAVRRVSAIDASRETIEASDLVLVAATVGDETFLRRALEVVETTERPVIVIFDAHDEAATFAAIRAGATECLAKWRFDGATLLRAVLSAVARRDAAESWADRHFRLRFVAEVCHEIRAPLHVILGMAEVLSETRLDAHQRDLTSRLRIAGEHLSGLVDDVVDLSRLESPGFTLDRVEFDLHELVMGTLDFMSGALRGKPIELRHRFGSGIPSLVSGDPRRLRQLLINLLGNAIKFTERGHVELAVSLDPTQPNSNRVRFSVTDTGIGIPRDRQGDVFSSFVQGSSIVGRKYGGFGLGLHITKRLVETMGGTVGLVSTEGQGSTFYLVVPLEPRVAGGSSIRSMLAVAAPPARPPQRVLLVDDSADNCLLVASYLARTEIALDTVESGVEALERTRASRYDVILMDMHMPGLDGYETTERIRAWEREQGQPPTPIIALTADALRDSVMRSFQVGCTAHVTKPVSKLELLDAIRRQARPAHRTEAAANPEIDPAVVPLLPRYLANRRRDVGVMRTALSSGDLRVVSTLAHNMKGTGRSYGMHTVSELGRAIEQALVDTDMARASTLVDELEAALSSRDAERAS